MVRSCSSASRGSTTATIHPIQLHQLSSFESLTPILSTSCHGNPELPLQYPTASFRIDRIHYGVSHQLPDHEELLGSSSMSMGDFVACFIQEEHDEIEEQEDHEKHKTGPHGADQVHEHDKPTEEESLCCCC